MMERILGIHLEWYRRHISHMALALEALEDGDSQAACYHSYQAVSTLLSGVLGLDPYSPGPVVKTIGSMLKSAVEILPPGAESCASALERQYYGGQDGEICVRCAELLTDLIHQVIK